MPSDPHACPPFPTVAWGAATMTFHATRPPRGARPAAVVVFARHDDGFVIADVPRGWCTPSGHLEPGETPLEAARRETREEIGADLLRPRRIGHFAVRDTVGAEQIVPAYLGFVDGFGALPPGTESRGARLAALADLPGLYCRWNDLMAAVFTYADSLARGERA